MRHDARMAEDSIACVPVQGVRRLPFVDGIRGLAATIVLLNHLIFIVPDMRAPEAGDAAWQDWLVWPFRFGGEMVFLFLFVSGFSLYYSERSRQLKGRPATTFRQFIARRAWRIGPVYYTAFVFGLAVLPIVINLRLRAETAVPSLTAGGVVSHLFLVHNLRTTWLYQANGPLWSIAFEAQLYLLFPILFVAMRRWNPLVVAVGVVAAVKAVSLLHLGFPVFGLARWFVAGALLAELAARGIRLDLRVALPVGMASLLLGMASLPQLGSELRHDAIWLVAFVFLALAALEAPASSRNPMVWEPLRWLGLRSYSLYALHWPLLLLLLLLAQDLELHGRVAALLTVGLGVPLALAVSALSFRFIEGPSLRRVARVGEPQRRVAPR